MDGNGNTVDEDGQFSLICPSTAGYCSTGQGTYVWDPPGDDDTCPLYLTRDTTGLVITDSEGVDTFMSSDGSMLRLILTEKLSMCNHLVHRTNYPDLYLADQTGVEAFQRPISKKEIVVHVYNNMGDD
jgi:hypothetical protein